METPRSGGRLWFLFSFLVAFLLLCGTNADGGIEEIVGPTANVNLTPFREWISSYECLQNISKSCQDKYNLTEEGWVKVSLEDTEEYCKQGGCAQHNIAVLTCIYLVNRDFKFVDKTTAKDVNHNITQTCSFGATPLLSNARKGCESKTTLLVSIVPALFLLMKYFH